MTFTLSHIAIAQLVLTPVLPILVGLVTTKITSGRAKAWLLAALSLFASLLSEAIKTWQGGGIYDVGAGLTLALPTFLVAVGMHYGLWKPTGLSGRAQSLLVTGGDVAGKHAERAGASATPNALGQPDSGQVTQLASELAAREPEVLRVHERPTRPRTT